mgnify:CR=1 FL=1
MRLDRRCQFFQRLRIHVAARLVFAALQQIQQLTSQLQQAEAENKRLSASLTALNTDKQTLATRLAAMEKVQQAAPDHAKALAADKQSLTTRLAVMEKEKQTALEQLKALNADKQSLANRLAAAEKAPSSRADAAVAAKDEPPEMAAIVAAYRLQADKDNAQLRMKEDEIQLLRTCRDKNRPLLQVENPEKKLKDLLKIRDPLYREVADYVIETNQGAARDLAQKILNLIIVQNQPQ